MVQGKFEAFDLDDVDGAFARFKTLKYSQHLKFSVSLGAPALCRASERGMSREGGRGRGAGAGTSR